MERDHTRNQGYAVLCDIVAFSQKSEVAQHACVKHLADQVLKSRLVKSHLPSDGDYVINCIGDGFILITTAEAVHRTPDLLLEFVREVLVGVHQWNRLPETAKQPDRGYRLRIGINTGTFFLEKAIFGRPNAIGNGVNIAARLANAGDPGHVLVSADVVKQIRDTESGVPDIDIGRENFVPKDEPWDIIVKHGVPLKVYSWWLDIDDERLGTQKPPRKVDILQRVQDQCMLELDRLRKRLERRLASVDKHFTPEALDLRLTVLHANFREEKLYCTPIRVWRGLPTDAIRISDTTFPIDNNKYWGMPAHILKHPAPSRKGRVLWQVDLPQWKKGNTKADKRSRDRYAKKLLEKWGTPQNIVFKLQRQARAYWGTIIPGLNDEPFGVLMIDSINPLSILDTSEEKRRKIADVVVEGAEMKLPLLLHIRYSL